MSVGGCRHGVPDRGNEKRRGRPDIEHLLAEMDRDVRVDDPHDRAGRASSHLPSMGRPIDGKRHSILNWDSACNRRPPKTLPLEQGVLRRKGSEKMAISITRGDAVSPTAYRQINPERRARRDPPRAAPLFRRYGGNPMRDERSVEEVTECILRICGAPN